MQQLLRNVTRQIALDIHTTGMHMTVQSQVRSDTLDTRMSLDASSAQGALELLRITAQVADLACLLDGNGLTLIPATSHHTLT